VSEVFFYHLTRQSVDQALRPLLAKCAGQGWRVAVQGSRADYIKWLDDKLWLGPDDGFSPHGVAGGVHDAHQPVLLSDTTMGPGFDCLISVDMAEVPADAVAQHKRVCILFDASDDAAMTVARGQWSRLTDAGCVAKYWSEESGKWELKVSKNA